MRKSLKRNYIFNLTYQILSVLIPLVTIPYLSRVLQTEAVGIFSYSESIVSYFCLFAVLGSAVYAQREIGKVQDNMEVRSRVFWEILIIRTLSSVIAIAAYIPYAFIVKSNLNICLIFSLEIVAVAVDINWFFQGIEEFGKTAVFGLCAKILNLVAIFVFVKSPSDLWIYALSKCGFGLLGSLAMWALMPKYLKKTSKVRPFTHLKVIITFFIPAIASQVYMVLDKSMIGWFTVTREENGYYEYAEKIVRASILVISSLASVLVPRISKAYAENDIDSVNRIIYKAIRYAWLMAIPIMLGFLAIADIFIPVYLGDGFAKSILLLRIFSPLLLFVGMANIIGVSFLMPQNKQNVYLISVVVAALLNACMNLILIPRLYSVGAAISSIVAEFVSISIQIIYIVKKKMMRLQSIFLCSWKYWVAGIIMAATIYSVKLFLPITVWALIVLILLAVITYFIALLIIRDSMLLEALNKGMCLVKSIICRRAESKSTSNVNPVSRDEIEENPENNNTVDTLNIIAASHEEIETFIDENYIDNSMAKSEKYADHTMIANEDGHDSRDD